MDEAAPDHEKGASKWGRERWRRGVAAALLLPVVACVAWYLFRHFASSVRQKPKADPKVRSVLHLEPFLVNLADPDGNRFLRVGIDLGLARELGEHERAGQSELPIARIRDTILMILTTYKTDALLAPAGKAQLKDELTKALRDHAPELDLKEIYFTEFLVQR
jgi:flagellar basal body-associated protein FliL